jgi:hypothetical protein
MIDIDKTVNKLRLKLKDLPASFLNTQQKVHDTKKSWGRDRLQLLNEEWVTLRGAKRFKIKFRWTEMASFLYLACGRAES